MIGPRQFSLWYLLAEMTCIAVAIGLVRHLYLTQDVFWPQTWWWAAPAAAVAIPAAIGGLFGQMKNGALAGVAGILIYVVVMAFPFFPQVH